MEQFDISNMGGLGVLGGVVLAAGIFLLNWFMNSSKPTKVRKKEHKATQQDLGSVITDIIVNKIPEIEKKIEDSNKKSEEQEKKIEDTVEEISKILEDGYKDDDTKLVDRAKRIQTKWNKLN